MLSEKIENIVCSFSGGRSSARMIEILENSPEYKNIKKHYVFANTGKELINTILFVKNCEYLFNIKVWLIEADINPEKGIGTSYKIIDKFDQLSMDGEPYLEMVKKYGLPSVSYPHCTRELKIVPISKFIKNHLNLTKQNTVQAIGFRFDEPRRINYKPHFIYPLYDHKVTEEQVIDYWVNGEYSLYDLMLEDFEGNCDFCFKKSWHKLKKMSKKHPSKVHWWANLEQEYLEPGSEMYRGHKTIYDLLNDANYFDNDIPCACGKSEDFFEVL